VREAEKNFVPVHLLDHLGLLRAIFSTAGKSIPLLRWQSVPFLIKFLSSSLTSLTQLDQVNVG